MRILHLIDSLVGGGKERRLVEFLKSTQLRTDIESRLVLLSDTIEYTDIGNIGVPIDLIRRSRRRDLAVYSKLLKLFRRYRPDIIHSWESMCSVYAAPLCRLMRVPFINAMITNATPFKPGSDKWFRSKITFPLSNLILANSQAGLAAYHAPPRKSAWVHNGFDFRRLAQITPASDLLMKHGIHTPRIIGMVGTIDHRKDYDTFLKIAFRITQERPDTGFLALGDGPLLEHYRSLTVGPKMKRIHFLGRQTDIESYVQLFEIGILLSRPDRHGEGISNAVMEYMALGKPVIATLGGGTAEIVIDRVTGFLVPENDPDLLQSYINYLLDHPEQARNMGVTGRKRVQTDFSMEKMTESIIAHYKACLNRRINVP